MSGIQNGRSPRSVALVGPYSSGKSTLFEALLDAAGAAVKRPADPRNRPMTTEIRLGHCSYLGDPWSVLDCPGSIEFTHQTCSALAMVDIAVVVCEPTPTKAAMVAPLLKTLKEEGVPHIVFINKIDTLDGSIADTLAALQAYAASPLVLRQMPIFDGPTVTGYVDLMSERAYRYRKGQASELMQIPAAMLADEQVALGRLVETLADHDDALLEKVLEDMKPTPDELYRDMRKDLLAGSVIEVLVGAAENANGVRRLWKALRHDTPDPSETAERREIVPAERRARRFSRPPMQAHREVVLRPNWSGTISDGTRQRAGTRLGAIYHTFRRWRPDKGPRSKTRRYRRIRPSRWCADRRHLVARRATGTPALSEDYPARLCDGDCHNRPERRRKLSGALAKVAEEDPSLFITQEGETVLHGQGEMHLQTTVDHLARDYGLKLSTHKPSVAYKETIRKAVHEHGRLKRQTGGHGQFADVKIDVAPRARGEGFQFIDKIVGGAVPRNHSRRR